MSNQYHEALLETTMSRVTAMSLDDFQNKCEEYKIDCAIIDEMAAELTHKLVEDRCE